MKSENINYATKGQSLGGCSGLWVTIFGFYPILEAADVDIAQQKGEGPYSLVRVREMEPQTLSLELDMNTLTRGCTVKAEASPSGKGRVRQDSRSCGDWGWDTEAGGRGGVGGHKGSESDSVLRWRAILGLVHLGTGTAKIWI